MMLAPSANKQSPGRWQARVLRVDRAPIEPVWTGERIHRTMRAAMYEAERKAEELSR